MLTTISPDPGAYLGGGGAQGARAPPSVSRMNTRMDVVAKNFAHSGYAPEIEANGGFALFPVFEQAKPVLIAAVLLICMILNLVNH